MRYDAVPGFVEQKEAFGETTVVVDAPKIREACAHMRDELGFNFLADIVATDYLNWAAKGVSGFIGTASGRDMNKPMTQGLHVLPQPKPWRFTVSYHLLAMRRDVIGVGVADEDFFGAGLRFVGVEPQPEFRQMHAVVLEIDSERHGAI